MAKLLASTKSVIPKWHTNQNNRGGRVRAARIPQKNNEPASPRPELFLQFCRESPDFCERHTSAFHRATHRATYGNSWPRGVALHGMRRIGKQIFCHGLLPGVFGASEDGTAEIPRNNKVGFSVVFDSTEFAAQNFRG